MIRRLLRHCRLFSTHPLAIHRFQDTHPFLCNKRIGELNVLGRVDDARQVFDNMSQRDTFSWNNMITAYCRTGRLREARSLFDLFLGKNVRTWTAMLSGYAKHGLVGEAWALFESMPARNIVSWNAMITGYVQNGVLDSARRLFREMPERNIGSWNAIITGYCRYGQMNEAKELFNLMAERNTVSYNVMLSGYVDIGNYLEAWNVFVMFHGSGLKPDQPILVLGLSAAIGLDEPKMIDKSRTFAFKTGFEGDVVVDTAILNAYTRNFCLNVAVKFFGMMQERNDYAWTTMIAAYSRCGRLNEAMALYKMIPKPSSTIQTALMTAHAQNGNIHVAKRMFEEIKNPNIITWNAIIAGCAQNGMVEEAKDFFLRMPVRNAASSAAMISGLVHSGLNDEALQVFTNIHRLGNLPSLSGFTSALFACANIGADKMGRQIHALTIKTRSHNNSYVGNGLISMYGKCKTVEDALKMNENPFLKSLISSSSKNDVLLDADCTFEGMPVRDDVSWTAIISAYEQAGQGCTALKLFRRMLAEGMKPNSITVTSLLSACGQIGDTKLCEQIHGYILKLRFDFFLSVCNALITAYFKCGCLGGLALFEEMSNRDIITWNAILLGCAKHGLCERAIKVFKQMEDEGVFPNQTSFAAILYACSHAGLVDKGWSYFKSMNPNYGIAPSIHHYTCMVDLLGRAGQLAEAEVLIETMPEKPDAVIWEALLAACRVHGNFELGQKVAERILHMGTQKSGTYTLLSNIYASQGLWDKVQEVRELMRDRGVTKEAGISWIHNRNRLHYFLTGENMCDKNKKIQSSLNEFYGRFKAAGYVSDSKFVLHDVDEEQKENELLYHSEKLAVIFGLLSTPDVVPLQIMKNLRICGDCHSFMKFASKDTQRKIIIRDRNRFHHFQDGLCSCGDYW